MPSSRHRRAAWAILPALSCVAFAVAAARGSPDLLGRRATPPPITAGEREEILRALDLSRRIYADFFASGGAPALLDDFPASRGVKHRIFRDIGFLRDRGLLQIQDLAEAIPVSVERTAGDAVEAVVYEEWNYLVQRVADRKPASEVRGLGGGFRYVLQRAGSGRWTIVSWEPVTMAKPAEPPEFKY